MRRRNLLALAATAAVLPASTGWAQEAGRKYLLGFLVQAPRPRYAALFEELHRLGFIEGSNLSVAPNGFSLAVEQLEAAAVEVAQTKPDAIFCGGDAAARAAQQATDTIPLVTIADDALRNRLVVSLARPAGNLTGISIFASELNGKRLELLIELLPGIRRIAALIDPATTTIEQLQALIAAARSRSVSCPFIVSRRRRTLFRPLKRRGRAERMRSTFLPRPFSMPTGR